MNRIIINDCGVYVWDMLGDMKCEMTLNDVIDKIGKKECMPFGVIYYQLTPRVISMLLTSKECWDCCMCPIVDSEGRAFTALATEYNSSEELLKDCKTHIENMQGLINTKNIRIYAHMAVRWIGSLSKNRWIQKCSSKMYIMSYVHNEEISIFAEKDSSECSIYADMADDAAAFGVIETINNKEGDIDVATYIRISDELVKKGCAVYSIMSTEDVNVLKVVGACSTNKMQEILEEVTMFKEYSDNIGSIGYCKYHDVDMLSGEDYDDIK